MFLVLGFSQGSFPFEGTWEESGFTYSWIAFPVGGILCAIVDVITSAVYKSREELIAEVRKENPWVKVEQEEKSDG